MPQITKGRTIFIIAHRLSIVRHADRILTIERGRLAEDGSHDEWVKTGGRYASLFRLQAGVREVSSGQIPEGLKGKHPWVIVPLFPQSVQKYPYFVRFRIPKRRMAGTARRLSPACPDVKTARNHPNPLPPRHLLSISLPVGPAL
jgi:hypothetical protein